MKTKQRILLIIGGGIAAYKSLELIRLFKSNDFAVRPVMTKAAAQFVTPLSIGALAGDKVYGDLFDLTDEAQMGHIELSRSADLVVVAPITADLMAKMANGQANDLASTLLMATDTPVLMAPAMNVRMWQHRANQRNLMTLLKDGIHCVGPDEGEMACGEFGPGRMAEPAMIFAAAQKHLASTSSSSQGPLSGKKILITAGPTHEPIDPVRYIANRSSGKQGYAIAQAAQGLGAEVVLISGPVNRPSPSGVTMIKVETAAQMLEACETNLPVDIGIFVAAVADWRAAQKASQKLKKQKGSPVPELVLEQNPDILRHIAGRKKQRPTIVIGFAAETENVVENATKKLTVKGCDLIVANNVNSDSGVMGGERNKVHLVSHDGVEDWPQMSKTQVAERLMMHIAKMTKT